MLMKNKLNFLEKIYIWFKKPAVIVVAENKFSADIINKILIKNKKRALIFNLKIKEIIDIINNNFLTKHSSLLIFVFYNINSEIKESIKKLPKNSYLIFNFNDEEIVKNLKNECPAKQLTFGFQEEVDFKVSDINSGENGEINFKINHEGDIVPFWSKEKINQEQILSILSAVAVGTIFDLNLIEISQSINYS